MHGSASLLGRLVAAILLSVALSSPATAGPKVGPGSHDPPPPPTQNGWTLDGIDPGPVPDGEPDDYMDRSAAMTAWHISLAISVTSWVVRLVR